MSAQQASRLIKAHAPRSSGVKVPFNVNDLRQQCDDHVEGARRQAESIIAQAEADADEIRRRAFEEGQAAGNRAGVAAAQDSIAALAAELAATQVQERVRTALPALTALVAAIEDERERWLAAWESEAVRLSAAIAERILRRELTQRPAVAGDLIRAALQLAAGKPQIRVRLNPRDLQELGPCDPEIERELSPAGRASLIADADVSPGGCVVETLHGTVDARIETQLRRIVEELTD